MLLLSMPKTSCWLAKNINKNIIAGTQAILVAWLSILFLGLCISVLLFSLRFIWLVWTHCRMFERHPERVLWKAVYGMLPKVWHCRAPLSLSWAPESAATLAHATLETVCRWQTSLRSAVVTSTKFVGEATLEWRWFTSLPRPFTHCVNNRYTTNQRRRG